MSYMPKFESVGPHDAELVHLLIGLFGVSDEDLLNEAVDSINEIFSEELELAWMYKDLTK